MTAFLALSLALFGYFLVAQQLAGTQPTTEFVLRAANWTIDTWIAVGIFVANASAARGGLVHT
jgi:hypothetical protein